MKVTKGISPLIASVLLLAFTMSIAMIAGPYFTDLMQSTQEGQTDQAQNIQSSTTADFDLQKSSYNPEEEKVTITVQNTGTSSISNYTVTAFGDTPVQKSFDGSLRAGEIQNIELNASSQPDRVEIAAENAPVAAEQEMSEDNIITGSAPSSPTGLSLSS